MNASHIKGAMMCIRDAVTADCDYLVKLDQQNGDGDLGISMSNGFDAVVRGIAEPPEADLGRLLQSCSSNMNEAAPSTLGTIMSLWMLGMAKALKGNQEATLPQLAQAMEKGVELIMKRTGSKPGEKTVLDALCPAVETLNRLSETGDWNQALSAAADAAVAGSEKTRQMLAVHGRASYYGEKSLGVIDGGSVVGGMIFTVLRDYGITVTGGDAH